MVEGETPIVVARLRIDGRRSPAQSTRPATLARITLITSMVRVPPRPFVCVSPSKAYDLPYPYSFAELYWIVAGLVTAEGRGSPPKKRGEHAIGGQWLGQRASRRRHRQRLAAGDARRGRRLLRAVPDVRARGHCRVDRCGRARPAPSGAAGAKGSRLARHRLHR